MAEPRTYSGNGQTATIADPDNITRDECFALARCGPSEWNRWRWEFPTRGAWPGPYENCADFTAQDFSQDHFDFSNLRFSGFKFGNQADFSGAKFSCGFFTGTEFGHNARFIEAQFGEGTSFEEAKFGKEACFSRSVFGPESSFAHCRFDILASFQSVFFDESICFDGAVFDDDAEFDWSHFQHRSSFVGTLFLGRASFVAASIGFEANFSGLMVGGALSFEAARFEGQTTFQGLTWGALKQELQLREGASALEELAGVSHANPWTLKAINFGGATFEGRIDFSDRVFEGLTEFSRTVFDIGAPGLSGLHEAVVSRVREELVVNEHGSVYLPKGKPARFACAPEFFQCKLHQNTSFDGAVFPQADGSEETARAYRVLKLASSQQQAIREEQRFFRLEMMEEAKAAERSRDPSRWLYVAYRELADFGFSVRRPVLLLIAAVFLMLPLYAWQAGLQACWPASAGCSMTGPLIQFAIAHALPGFEKLAEPANKALFADQLGVWTVLTLLFHKAASLLALFLIGLALRNLFKMK